MNYNSNQPITFLKNGVLFAWFGDQEGHARAGRIGGLKNSKDKNPANFANNIEKAREAGKKSKRKSNVPRNSQTSPT